MVRVRTFLQSNLARYRIGAPWSESVAVRKGRHSPSLSNMIE